MDLLTLELTPLRPAVRNDAPVTLDVLLRITPAAPAEVPCRPRLNIGLVLDHSGSMIGGNKIGFARQAAVYAVEQLLPEDWVSVTIFDDQVETIVPSAPAADKPGLVECLNRVQPRGSTALHAGWAEGGRQVRQHRIEGGLNRVLLLTDGLANVGETVPDVIATDVKRLALEGVSTTTLGVGKDYNEDLLEAMARSGDGNYYFIESPTQLADIFQTELRGLMATTGRAVRLGLEFLGGTTLADVLNDFQRDPEGRLQLPNLVAGMPVEVVLRLNVPPQAYAAGLCRFHLTWQDPRRGEQQQSVTLALPPLSGDDWHALAEDLTVRERAALLLAGRCKREATRFLERADLEGARRWLAQARQAIAGLPRSPLVEQEWRDLDELDRRLERGDLVTSSKLAKYQHYQRSHTKP
jgi:Ca-activated chloride channel family protein